MAGQAASEVPDGTRGGCSFGLLGPLVVVRDGHSLALGGRQQRAVLARLLIQTGAVVSVDQLLLALWGERPTDGAVTTVQTYVSHLREVLEPDRSRGAAPRLLLTEPRGYRLAVPDLAVDAMVFEQAVSAGRCALAAGRFEDASTGLDRALRLWRGDVLSDLADFDFTREASAQLAGLRLSALEDRCEADLALGRHRQVADELDSVAAAHPLRERVHAQRMLALYRCGRQAEALAAYGSLRDTLAEELGIDPNPEVQGLHLAILRQDPALHVERPPPAVQQPAPPVAQLAGAVGAERAGGPDGGGPGRTGRDGRRGPSRRWLAAASVAVVVLSLVGASARSAGGPADGPQRSTGRSPPLLGVNSVGRLDAATGLGSAVRVGQDPAGLAYGAGALWVANEGSRTVTRVDPSDDRVVSTVAVGVAPSAVAVTGDDVWVVDGGDATVSRVNARTNRKVQVIRVGNAPSAIAAGSGGVWVANGADDTIQRIDPQSGRPDPPIDVGDTPSGVAVAAGIVWVANAGDGTVSRVDARTGDLRSPIKVGVGPRGLAVTRGAVWVANSLELSVTRIDPLRGRVVRTVRVGDGPRSVVAGAGAVWVADEYGGRLDRIDPRTNRVARRVPLGGSPRAVAAAGASVWVATGPPTGSAHRGGTVVVDSSVVPTFETVDPARNWSAATMSMAYDGLVGLRRTGGSDGTTLVPDLATRLPRPTDGGRTYRFTLRRGIRYSDGGSVLATDLRRGVERALRGPGQRYYLGILGARGCVTHPSDCDLTRGVVTDDERAQVIFHLTSPDPTSWRS